MMTPLIVFVVIMSSVVIWFLWHIYPKTEHDNKSPIRKMSCPNCLVKGGMVVKRESLGKHFVRCKCGYKSYGYYHISELYEYLHEQGYRVKLVSKKLSERSESI